MEEEKFRREIIDDEHLRLLSLFHYIFGGIVLAYSLFVVLQFAVLIYFFETIWTDYPMNTYSSQEEFSPMFFKFFLYAVIFLFVIMLTGGILEILSGKFIKSRKHRNFSYAIAILNLLAIPYGSILGIMTITVLGRNSIKDLYFRNKFANEPLKNI